MMGIEGAVGGGGAHRKQVMLWSLDVELKTNDFYRYNINKCRMHHFAFHADGQSTSER